jgi:hypothetical protein
VARDKVFFLLVIDFAIISNEAHCTITVPWSTLGCGKGKSKRIKKKEIIEVNSIIRKIIELGVL